MDISNPAGFGSPLLRELAWRGLIADVTKLSDLDRHLVEGNRSVYVGFDPTADSLHIGSLLPLLALRRVQLNGHRAIVLVGGGTGLIGDPSGKTGERPLTSEEQVALWGEQLKRQVERFIEFDKRGDRAILLNNYDWLSQLHVIPFLRDTGKHFSVGSMMAREAVKSRLGRSDVGLSYTEFSYQVLQSYDFLSLFKNHGCTVQFGGTDQWGNITAGIELVRRVTRQEAFGLTHPLVTRTDGGKFGKTEAGTIWLDANKTSPYDMYQFWVNTADADVTAYLKYFTFLAESQVTELDAERMAAPEKREAQRVLAREVTQIVHGKEATIRAERASAVLFGGEGAPSDLIGEGGAIPGAALPSEAASWPMWKVLKEAGLVVSSSEARRLIQQGGVQVNDQRVVHPDEHLPAGGHTIKLGKRRMFRVLVGDQYIV